VAASRGRLLRWGGWFGLANGILWGLIGLRYLIGYAFPGDLLGVVYTPLAYLGHFVTLGILPLLLTLPVLLAWPRRWLVMGLMVLLSAALGTALVVDGNVFAEHRYHLTPLTVAIFAPSTWVFVALMGIMALVFETLLAGAVWNWISARRNRHGVLVGLVLAGAWLTGQGIHIWADAIGYRSVTQLTRYLPAYFPIHSKRRLARWGLVDAERVARQQLLEEAGRAAGADGQLHYPRSPLQCAVPADPPLNLLVVLLDAIRPEMVDPALMPNLAALRNGGQDFANHWSGGNSSRAGIFSFFYGLPSTYMETFYGVQRSPVLLDQLRAAGYELVLHAAPGFGPPTDISRTVFAGIPGLPGEDHSLGAEDRNRAVTEGWLRWLQSRDGSRPFFGFLYYDPPMGAMAAESDPALPLGDRLAVPAKLEGEWNRYRRSARFVDGELGRIRESLAAAGLAERTVLVVFSDHGYEFDDYGNGYSGHANSYSPAQLRAVLALDWPGREPARYTHRSSHFDVPVTLLQDLLGCTNPPADYAVGRNLFAGESWEWIVAGSYTSHAIVQPDRVTVANPGGFVEVLGTDYRPLPDADPDAGVIGQAMAEMRRFYR
jgi:membrane-anchored protein YejM (alkaline phosphatase superfamily)